MDRLSSLPEEVLSHILSLMPVKYVVRTSILSNRWRWRWMSVTNLNFADIQPVHGLECLTECVDRVLKLCTTSQLKLFRLPSDTFDLPESTISRWISEAVRLNVRELDVHAMQVEFPVCLTSCKTLTTLKLRYSGIMGKDVWNLSSPVSLPCLKTLDIGVYREPSVKLFTLIQGCPLIESLILRISLLPNEKEYNFSIPTLKRLKLTIMNRNQSTKVILNARNLQYLKVCGTSFMSFVIEDLSSLVKAVAISTPIIQMSDLLIGAEFLRRLSGVKLLSLSCPTIDQCMELPIFSNLKQLKLKRHYQSSAWLLVVCKFLQSASNLEYLKVEYSFMEEPMPEDRCWIEPPSVPTCMLTNLKTLYIEQTYGRKFVLQFLEYMLGNAKVLKTLIIENLISPPEGELQRLLKFPRVSSNCAVYIDGKHIVTCPSIDMPPLATIAPGSDDPPLESSKEPLAIMPPQTTVDDDDDDEAFLESSMAVIRGRMRLRYRTGKIKG